MTVQSENSSITGARGHFTSYVIDEFGVAVPAVILLFALFFWFRRNGLKETDK